MRRYWFGVRMLVVQAKELRINSQVGGSGALRVRGWV